MTEKELEQKIIKMKELHETFLLAEDLIHAYIIKKMKKYCKKKGYHLHSNNIFSCQKELQNTEFEPYFNALLQKNNLRYSTTIREAIIYLLSKKEELDYPLNPVYFPGIIRITQANNAFKIDTIMGEIYVKNATSIFENSSSSNIFQKTLTGCCYTRSYEFLEENKEYQVIFSWMPNLFAGGHYHVYLKNKASVLDIASNAYYENYTYQIPLTGKKFKIATFEEIQKDLQDIPKNLPWNDKLFLLSHYYDLMYHKNLTRKRIKK